MSHISSETSRPRVHIQFSRSFGPFRASLSPKCRYLFTSVLRRDGVSFQGLIHCIIYGGCCWKGLGAGRVYSINLTPGFSSPPVPVLSSWRQTTFFISPLAPLLLISPRLVFNLYFCHLNDSLRYKFEYRASMDPGWFSEQPFLDCVWVLCVCNRAKTSYNCSFQIKEARYNVNVVHLLWRSIKWKI